MKPLMLDLSASRVLVIGSGAVGMRKAAYFKEVCDVVVLDEVPENLAAGIQPYTIIIAATASPKLNEKICEAAAAQGKWYNSATGVGNFLIPATYQDDGFTLSVSTSGKSPAVASFIRDKVCEAYPSLPKMIALQETLRSELKVCVEDQPRRAAILRAILDDAEIWAALDSDNEGKALTLARRLYEH